MNTRSDWYDKFEELLWEYHGCDWSLGKRIPEFSFRLAVAYFNWGINGRPEETPEQAFTRYLGTVDK